MVGKMPDRPGGPKRVLRVCWECLAEENFNCIPVKSSVLVDGNPENTFGVRLRKTSALLRFNSEEEVSESVVESQTICKLDSPQPVGTRPVGPNINKPAVPKKPELHGDTGGKLRRVSEPAAGRGAAGGTNPPSWISVARQKQKIYKENSLEEMTVRKDGQETKSWSPHRAGSRKNQNQKTTETTESSKQPVIIEKETRRVLSPPTPVPPQPSRSQLLPSPVTPQAQVSSITQKLQVSSGAPQAQVSPVAPKPQVSSVAPQAQVSPVAPKPQVSSGAPQAQVSPVAPQAQVSSVTQKLQVSPVTVKPPQTSMSLPTHPVPSKRLPFITPTPFSKAATTAQTSPVTSPPFPSRTTTDKFSFKAPDVPRPAGSPSALAQVEPPWMALAKKKAKAWSEMPQIVQ